MNPTEAALRPATFSCDFEVVLTEVEGDKCLPFI